VKSFQLNLCLSRQLANITQCSQVVSVRQWKSVARSKAAWATQWDLLSKTDIKWTRKQNRIATCPVVIADAIFFFHLCATRVFDPGKIISGQWMTQIWVLSRLFHCQHSWHVIITSYFCSKDFKVIAFHPLWMLKNSSVPHKNGQKYVFRKQFFILFNFLQILFFACM
jgi:hypothetical protein